MAENWNVHGVYWLLRNASNSGALEADEYQPLPTREDAAFIANAPTMAAELVAARARIAELETQIAASRQGIVVRDVFGKDREAAIQEMISDFVQGDKPCP